MWQPWASLWLARPKSRPRAKLHETRHWHVSRYGIVIPERVLVHAARTKNTAVREMLDDHTVRQLLADCGLDDRSLPFGGLIGSINITACHLMSEMPEPDPVDRALGLWTPERFAFRGEDPVTFHTPIPYKAVQTPFFRVDLIGTMLREIDSKG